MQGSPTQAPKTHTERHFREESEDRPEERDDTAATKLGDLDVTFEDDIGSDPYNRTGRFERIVR